MPTNISDLIVPRTEVRLSPYIQILAGLGGYDPLNPSGFANALAKATVIGTVQELTVTNKREAYFYRELGLQSMGTILETYQGLPTYDLTLKRIVLYSSNLLEAFGFYGEDIINQQVPVALLLNLVSPTDQTFAAGTAGAQGQVGDAVLNSQVYNPTPGVNTTTGQGYSIGGTRAWVFEGVIFKDNDMTFSITADELKIEQDVTAIAKNISAVRTPSTTAI